MRRRRRCPSCGEVFRTDEALATETLKVKKQDGTVQDYARSKITKGIEKAAWSYNKSLGGGRLAPSDINAIVERVENLLRSKGARVVPSVEIGRLVLQELTDGTPGGEVVRARFAIVFHGRTTKAGGFRNMRGLMDWVQDVYGEPNVDRPDSLPSVVRKRDGKTEPFQIKSIEASIGIAAKGNGNDTQVYRYAERLAAEVVEQLQDQVIVTSQQIAAEVLKLFIREKDTLSYLRYASAVKRYGSINDFWLESYAFDADAEV